MVFDEATKEYKPRFGYKRINDAENDWLIPVPGNAGTHSEGVVVRALWPYEALRSPTRPDD